LRAAEDAVEDRQSLVADAGGDRQLRAPRLDGRRSDVLQQQRPEDWDEQWFTVSW
jgi:hypothetical protein